MFPHVPLKFWVVVILIIIIIISTFSSRMVPISLFSQACSRLPSNPDKTQSRPKVTLQVSYGAVFCTTR